MALLREVKKQRRRDRIYKSSIELLNEKGFADTHMREIAERAELAVGTLYNYYPSKHDLYMEIIEEKWKELVLVHNRRILRLVCTENDLFTIIHNIFFPLMRDFFSLGIGKWSELFMAVFSSKTYLKRGAMMDLEALEQLERLLHKLQKRGVMNSEVSARAAASSLYAAAAFNFMFYLFIESSTKEDFFRGLDEQLRLLVEGLGPPPSKEEHI